MDYATMDEEAFEAAVDFLVEARAEGALSYLHDEAMSVLVKSVSCPFLRAIGRRQERVFWMLDVEELTWKQL